MKHYIEKLTSGVSLTYKEMQQACKCLLQEDITDSEIAAFLMTLKAKGETVEEIAGLVKVLQANALPFTSRLSGVTDNCGTGGDGSQSFNISTTAAFVIAGAGVKVAKHGNRSISSKTGSADVLESLGVALDFHNEEVEELLSTNGIAFLFAPNVHRQVTRVAKVRKELNIPTIFNLIGPLTNPVMLDHQLVGVYRRDLLIKIAKVLNKLGRNRAIVLNGAGYMDEASLAGVNHYVLLNNGTIETKTISPEEVGLNTFENEKIIGGNARDNAQILLEVLNGKEGPHYETVLLNAGLGIFAAGKVNSIFEGVKLAEESIKTGAALAKLQFLQQYSKNRKRVMS
jgi:anthranilate phosphoribosyltransferase